MKPGIYFNMPEDEYHAVPALSTSGIKLLLESPEEFWYRSWLNPDRPEPEKKDCLERGKLWETRLMEPEQFNNKYCRFSRSMFEEKGLTVLDTVSDIKDFLDGHSIPYKKSGKKDDFIEAAMAAQCDDIVVLEAERQKMIAAYPDKTIIYSDEMWENMLASESVFKAHPYFSTVFSGGYAQVAIFWQDDSGLPMKCRIDYLKTGAILDYKTLYVRRGMGIDQAALNSIKYEHYDIQAAVYSIGVGRSVTEALPVHGDVPGAFVDAFRKQSEKPFGFIFQQEERPNAIRGKVVERQVGEMFNAFGAGLLFMQKGIETFLEFYKQYGEKRWVDPRGMEAVGDNDIYYN